MIIVSFQNYMNIVEVKQNKNIKDSYKIFIE